MSVLFDMNKLVKLSLAVMTVGALAIGANAAIAGPHHWGYDQGYGYDDGFGQCGGLGCGYGPHHGFNGNGPCGNAPCWQQGGPRPDFGPMPRMGREVYEQFKADFDKIDQMRDAVFVQRKVLDSRVNAGSPETEAEAQKLVKMRNELREARYNLHQKIASYYQSQKPMAPRPAQVQEKK